MEFPGARVLALLEESDSAQERLMTEAQRYLAAGIDLHSLNPDWVDEVEHPVTGAPPGLWLMNDGGACLRSNASDRANTGAAVRDVRCDAALADEPLCEFIDARSLRQLRPDDTLVIVLSERKIRLSIVRRD